jgi:hypothetical protein
LPSRLTDCLSSQHWRLVSLLVGVFVTFKMQKMKALLVLFLVFFPGMTAFAQQVIASTGHSGSTTGMVVDWTLGEPVVATYTGAAITLTQGMHQPKVLVTHLQGPAGLGFEVRVYPNPVENRLLIELRQPVAGVFWYGFFDVTGRTLHKKVMQSNTEEIDTGGFPPGVYFVRILSDESGYFSTFKIIKK